jgi:cysteine desulfurase/selenocysteine lyase
VTGALLAKWVSVNEITRRELGRLAALAWLGAGRWPGAAAVAPSPAGLPDVRRWRGDFPALDQSVNGRRLAYLDSAATTQRPRAVLEAMLDYYRHDNANPGGALHALARRAHERYEHARATVPAFINPGQPDEVVWVRGTTEGINLVASAWARPRIRPGDELLLTVAEHASNLLPWRLVAEQTGATLRYVDLDDAGRVRPDDLERKLSARTRLFSFSHVSNVTGYINPAAQLCARARSAGARVLIDAAQSAPHVSLDVQSLGCDFLVFSGHKMLGPMGAGVLWGRRELLEEMPPYQAGSNMAHAIDIASQEFEHAARKFGAGTPNVSGAIGLAAAVNYLNALDRGVIERHEALLTRYALEQLKQIPDLRLLGPSTPIDRLPVFSFVLPQQSASEILHYLDSQGIAVRAGDLAALPLLKHFGVSAAARASCYLYTQAAEIDRLCAALRDLTRTRAKEPK